ncbi:hypothetical protein MKZ38_004758 [Zalerion maritima]|uniref:Uncharacterized protein n=1 Tax=Zalerion maritima TaxID=339359 RepID=A0AAD5S490_9PEZI|nr:hypothetical protein MKZ38_004758 [Zalerion maritima]
MLPCSAGIFHYSPYTQGNLKPQAANFKYIRYRAPKKSRKPKAARALPLLVSLPSILASLSVETNRWLEAPNIKAIDSNMDKLPINLQQQQRQHAADYDSFDGENMHQEKPLLAQVARLTRAHTIKMPHSKASGWDKAKGPKPLNLGRKSLERQRGEHPADVGDNRHHVALRSSSFESISHGRGLVRVPPPLGDRKILTSAGPQRRHTGGGDKYTRTPIAPRRVNSTHIGSGRVSRPRSNRESMIFLSDSSHESSQPGPSLQRKKSETRGARLGEMMTGRISQDSLRTTRRRTSSTSTYSGARDDGSSLEQSYIPIGLGIMADTVIESRSGKTRSEDDQDEWSDESVYSQDSKPGSSSRSAVGSSSATAFPGIEASSYQTAAPLPLNTPGLRSETMSSQRALEHDDSVQSLGRRKLSPPGEYYQRQSPFMSDALLVMPRTAGNQPEKLSSGSRRSLVPPPRLSERNLIPLRAASTSSVIQQSKSAGKYKASELGQGEMVCLKRVAEEAKRGRASQIPEEHLSGQNESSTQSLQIEGLRKVLCNRLEEKQRSEATAKEGDQPPTSLKKASPGKRLYDASVYTSPCTTSRPEFAISIDKESLRRRKVECPSIDTPVTLPSSRYLQPPPASLAPQPISAGAGHNDLTLRRRAYSIGELSAGSAAPTPSSARQGFREPQATPAMPTVHPSPRPQQRRPPPRRPVRKNTTILQWQKREMEQLQQSSLDFIVNDDGLGPLTLEPVDIDATPEGPTKSKARKNRGGQEAQGKGSARMYQYFRERRRARTSARAAKLLEEPVGGKRLLGVVAEGVESGSEGGHVQSGYGGDMPRDIDGYEYGEGWGEWEDESVYGDDGKEGEEGGGYEEIFDFYAYD